MNKYKKKKYIIMILIIVSIIIVANIKIINVTYLKIKIIFKVKHYYDAQYSGHQSYLSFSNIHNIKSDFVKSYNIYSFDLHTGYRNDAKVVVFENNKDLKIVYDAYVTGDVVKDSNNDDSNVSYGMFLNLQKYNKIIVNEQISLNDNNIQKYVKDILKIICPENDIVYFEQSELKKQIRVIKNENIRSNTKNILQLDNVFLTKAKPMKIKKEKEYYEILVYTWQACGGILYYSIIRVEDNGFIVIRNISVVRTEIGPYHLHI